MAQILTPIQQKNFKKAARKLAENYQIPNTNQDRDKIYHQHLEEKYAQQLLSKPDREINQPETYP